MLYVIFGKVQSSSTENELKSCILSELISYIQPDPQYRDHTSNPYDNNKKTIALYC